MKQQYLIELITFQTPNITPHSSVAEITTWLNDALDSGIFHLMDLHIHNNSKISTDFNYGTNLKAPVTNIKLLVEIDTSEKSLSCTDDVIKAIQIGIKGKQIECLEYTEFHSFNKLFCLAALDCNIQNLQEYIQPKI